MRLPLFAVSCLTFELSIRFDREVELPSLPEMVFPGNSLKLEHESGCVLEFVALDALKLVENTHDPLKVPVAEEWRQIAVSCHCILMYMC